MDGEAFDGITATEAEQREALAVATPVTEPIEQADDSLHTHIDRTHADIEERMQELTSLIDALCEENESLRTWKREHEAGHAAAAAPPVVVVQADEHANAEVEQWHAEAQEQLEQMNETLQEALTTPEPTPEPEPESPSTSSTPPEPTPESETVSPSSETGTVETEILNPPAPVAAANQAAEQRRRSLRRLSRR